ncbi:hypothetical protein [Janthinobacterium sp.]|uniref:hypothetical protein n=1 Tax=Janthinobacterium sp. TaxID=1871054 RepID=UPI002616BA9F|nr:hypothetical protein [Janthinobacterium sp.]
MPEQYRHFDSRGLSAPFAEQLISNPADGALAWLTSVLAIQSPALRAANAILLAYTGNPAAIDWVDDNAGSPVSSQWGVAAALLGTPWPRLAGWLQRGGPHRLMALDALLAYRKPAVNMSSLEQIAAPVLPQQPSKAEFATALNACLAINSTPRIESSVASLTRLADEILRDEARGVAVADLPRLYLNPGPFRNAPGILTQHNQVVEGMRENLQNMLQGKS